MPAACRPARAARQPAARRGAHVEPVGVERDRLRGLDDGRAVVEQQPLGGTRAAERVVHVRRRALAVEHVDRPLAAVGDRPLVAGDAGRAEAFGSAAAASRAPRTPLRLDGAASARRLLLRHDVQPPLGSSSGIRFSVANERPSRARKISPTPTPTDISIIWRPIPNANPVVYGTPYETSGSATAAWSRPMFPGQSGKIVATFISTSTSPAGSGASMPNARIATHTASSWRNQPRHWKKIASAAVAGERSTSSPTRAIASSRRRRLSSSTAGLRSRDVISATTSRIPPIAAAIARLVSAQSGSSPSGGT